MSKETRTAMGEAAMRKMEEGGEGTLHLIGEKDGMDGWMKLE